MPHFYKHYHELGVVRFAFGISGGKHNPSWDGVQDYNTHGAKVFLTETYTGSLNEKLEGVFINQTRLRFNEWYIPTDLDEFHYIKGFESFEKIKEQCTREGALFAETLFEDRITEDGHIPPNILPDISIFDQFPRNGRITELITHGCCNKICLASPSTPLTDGHHQTQSKYLPFSQLGTTYHFKWFGNLIEREKEKLAARIKNGYPFFTESKLLLEHLTNHEGKLI